MSETFAGRPKQFLADLTLAMRSAAEAGRTTIIEQARENAESYLESLRQDAGVRQAAIREAAAEDVAALREQSKAQAQLVRDASERRVAERRQTLDAAIAGYNRALEAELEQVNARVAAWERELDGFYMQLQDETDPTIFASLAATMPQPPDFGEADPSELVRKQESPKDQFVGAPAAVTAAVTAAEPAAAASSDAEELPDHWWLDSRYASRA